MFHVWSITVLYGMNTGYVYWFSTGNALGRLSDMIMSTAAMMIMVPTIFLRHYDEDSEKLESPVSGQRLRVRRELGSEVHADPVERAGGRRIGTKSLYLRIS